MPQIGNFVLFKANSYRSENRKRIGIRHELSKRTAIERKANSSTQLGMNSNSFPVWIGLYRNVRTTRSTTHHHVNGKRWFRFQCQLSKFWKHILLPGFGGDQVFYQVWYLKLVVQKNKWIFQQCSSWNRLTFWCVPHSYAKTTQLLKTIVVPKVTKPAPDFGRSIAANRSTCIPSRTWWDIPW